MPIVGVITLYSYLLTFTLHVHHDRLDYADQVLPEHPWMRVGGEASYKPIDSVVLSRLKQFGAMNKLKQLALKVIMENLSEEEINSLKAMFTNMDTDARASILFSENAKGLTIQSNLLSPLVVRDLGSKIYTEQGKIRLH